MMVGEDIGNLPIEIPKDAYYNGKDLPTFSAYLTIVVRDKDGKVTKIYRQRSHSPTSNFIYLLLPTSYYNMTGQTVTITNINGTSNSWATFKGPISYPNTATNNPSYLLMIQVGSGQQANPATATKLAAPISNGSGAGQLVYGQPSVSTNITASGSSVYFYISQTLNNLSGATITITEVGIVTQIQVNGTGCGYTVNLGPLLMWYDVISSPISVSNGGSVTIYYTFTVNP
jgi:hypothetical protein